MTQVAAHASFMFNLILARKIFGRVLVFISHHYTQVVFLPTDKNPEVLEKYFALASFTRVSAACGFTISRPCNKIEEYKCYVFLKMQWLSFGSTDHYDNGP